jgi:hypothetical protein
VAAIFDFPVYDIDGVDLDTDWVPVQADCELIKDGGTSTAITATAVDEGVTYSIALSATEMECARGVIKVQDAATKVILDLVMTFDTYGDASAQHLFNLNAAGDWNVGKTGYTLSQAFPANFADLAILASNGRVDLGLWIGNVPLNLVSQRVQSSAQVIGMGVNVITNNAMADDCIGAGQLDANAIDKIRDGILPTQNLAFNNMEFLFVAASDHATPVTGAGTMAVTRSIDGGSFGAGTGTGPAEVGNGIYQYDASPADMNGGIITFRFTATSGTPGAPDDRFVTVVTGGGV